jgi:hypothetical protein
MLKMNLEIQTYNNSQSNVDREICALLAQELCLSMPEAENKIWHGSPVWFLNGNPIVGYSKLKNCVQLLFWSGQSFGEDTLQKVGSFKAAEVRYTLIEQIDKDDLKRWLKKAKEIQWDYKNMRKNGRLDRLM